MKIKETPMKLKDFISLSKSVLETDEDVAPRYKCTRCHINIIDLPSVDFGDETLIDFNLSFDCMSKIKSVTGETISKKISNTIPLCDNCAKEVINFIMKSSDDGRDESSEETENEGYNENDKRILNLLSDD